MGTIGSAGMLVLAAMLVASGVPLSADSDKEAANTAIRDLDKGIHFEKLVIAEDTESPYVREASELFGLYVEDVAVPSKSMLLLVHPTLYVSDLELEIRRGEEIVRALAKIPGARVHAGRQVLVRLQFDQPVLTSKDSFRSYYRNRPGEAPEKYVPLRVTKIGGRFQ